MNYLHSGFFFMHLRLLITLLLPVTLSAQKTFTGTIDYRLTNTDTSLDVRVQAIFIPGRIRFHMQPVKVPAGADIKEELLILDFEQAAIFRIKDKEKIVERENIGGENSKQDLPALQPADTSQILGQPVRTYSSGWIEKTEVKGTDTIKSQVNASFAYASHLSYPIPDSLSREQMVPLFTNGHVCLGFAIRVRSAALRFDLLSRAWQLRPGKTRKLSKLFRFPKDYTQRQKD
ncbi:MAG: hypothetical protein BGO54_06050 [Sphingobacteriales bacterium 46-32]|nr:MAG: hypothetical protein BGO54_06050 [Sphingobacteriales bacterium 46-32]